SSGNDAHVTVSQFGHARPWARCSVTTTFGSGISTTCRDRYAVLAFAGMLALHCVQVSGEWSTMTSEFSTGRRVSPRWPFCPPGFLPDGSRKLLTRAFRDGFVSPSLAGGLLLLLLLSPSLRSSSSIRCRDRDRARSAVGEGFPFPLFRLRTGSQSHHGLRFSTPPYNAGRSDFPSPV